MRLLESWRYHLGLLHRVRHDCCGRTEARAAVDRVRRQQGRDPDDEQAAADHHPGAGRSRPEGQAGAASGRRGGRARPSRRSGRSPSTGSTTTTWRSTQEAVGWRASTSASADPDRPVLRRHTREEAGQIVPFTHPLTLLDLDELKRELDARPGEERGVTGVPRQGAGGRRRGSRTGTGRGAEERGQPDRGHRAADGPEVREVLPAHPGPGAGASHAQGTASSSSNHGLHLPHHRRAPARAGGRACSRKIDDWRAMVDCVMIDPTTTARCSSRAVRRAGAEDGSRRADGTNCRRPRRHRSR